MTSTATNTAAVAAAIQEAGDKVMPLPITISTRRNTVSRSGAPRSVMTGSLPSPPASLPTHKFVTPDSNMDMQDSAIDDELNDMSADEGDLDPEKARLRRGSDGQPILKEGRKGSRPDLRCETCGKGYKHSSCLTKHLCVPILLSQFLPPRTCPPSRSEPPPRILSSLLPFCAERAC